MKNNKNDKQKQTKDAPKFNNDQLGENASELHGENYNNKGSQAKEKRR